MYQSTWVFACTVFVPDRAPGRRHGPACQPVFRKGLVGNYNGGANQSDIHQFPEQSCLHRQFYQGLRVAALLHQFQQRSRESRPFDMQKVEGIVQSWDLGGR